MPVFSSKMILFGKAGLYTIIGMVSVRVSVTALQKWVEEQNNQRLSA